MKRQSGAAARTPWAKAARPFKPGRTFSPDRWPTTRVFDARPASTPARKADCSCRTSQHATFGARKLPWVMAKRVLLHPRHSRGADRGRATGPVVHHDGLADALGQRRGDQARHDVARTPGGKVTTSLTAWEGLDQACTNDGVRRRLRASGLDGDRASGRLLQGGEAFDGGMVGPVLQAGSGPSSAWACTHRRQMQALPRASAGRRWSKPAGKVSCAHQQAASTPPEATAAQPLGPPQRGHRGSGRAAPDGSDMA